MGKLYENGSPIANASNIKIKPGSIILKQGIPVGKDPDTVTFDLDKPINPKINGDYELEINSKKKEITITNVSNGTKVQAIIASDEEVDL